MWGPGLEEAGGGPGTVLPYGLTDEVLRMRQCFGKENGVFFSVLEKDQLAGCGTQYVWGDGTNGDS